MYEHLPGQIFSHFGGYVSSWTFNHMVIIAMRKIPTLSIICGVNFIWVDFAFSTSVDTPPHPMFCRHYLGRVVV